MLGECLAIRKSASSGRSVWAIGCFIFLLDKASSDNLSQNAKYCARHCDNDSLDFGKHPLSSSEFRNGFSTDQKREACHHETKTRSSS